MIRKHNPSVLPDLTQLYVDKHTPVTVDLELMGVTIEEYFGEEPYLEALQRRVTYHCDRLLPDDEELEHIFLEACGEHDVPAMAEAMDHAQCVIALRLLEQTCIEEGVSLDCRTNWEAVQ